jgi:hypothetical protein
MQIHKYVLASFATFGCALAQQQSPPQQTRPGKPLLDFTFPPLRPQKTEPGKLDFTFKPQRHPLPQNGLLTLIEKPVPDRLVHQSETPSPCSVPLLEAQIPKDTRFVVKQIRPSQNQMASMPQVKPPAPSCAEKSGAGYRR